MIKQQDGAIEPQAKIPSVTERTRIRMIDALRKHVRTPPRVNDGAQTQNHLAQVIEATPDFVVTIDGKGRVLYCNPAVRKMLGMKGEDEAAKLHLTDIYSPRSCATVLGEGIFIAILDGEWSGEASLLTCAGREVPVSQVIIAPAHADRRGEFLALIARNVEEIKQVEKSLRESERFYRRIAEVASIGIWIIDPKNQTRFVNPKMANMLGYSESEMLDQPATNFLRCDKIAFSQLDLDASHELLLRRKNGAELWVSLSPSVLYNELEQFAGILAVVTEITESRQRRDQVPLWSGLR